MADFEAPPDARTTFDRLVALCDPVRRDLYFYAIGRDGWVSRAEAAAALRLRPGLVAHHLDRLVADGLLEVEFRRLTGRSGPGAGRPAKLYRRAPRRFELSIPTRNPWLIGQLFIQAIKRAGKQAEPVRNALMEFAREVGYVFGDRARGGHSDATRRQALTDLLTRYGYEPQADGAELSLANCPYEALSSQDRDLVCPLNLALLEGAVERIGLRQASCSLVPPSNGGCCVRVRPWPGNTHIG